MLIASLTPIEFIRVSVLQEDMPRRPQAELSTFEQFEQNWYNAGRQIIADCAKIAFQLISEPSSNVTGARLATEVQANEEARKNEIIGAINKVHARFAEVENEFNTLKASNPEKDYVYNSFIQLLAYNETNFVNAIKSRKNFTPFYHSNPVIDKQFADKFSASNPDGFSSGELAPQAPPIPTPGTQPASKNPNNQIAAPATGYVTPGQIKLAPSWEDPRLK